MWRCHTVGVQGTERGFGGGYRSVHGGASVTKGFSRVLCLDRSGRVFLCLVGPAGCDCIQRVRGVRDVVWVFG